MSYLTNMWRVQEKPEYEIEHLSSGLWVLWGPCGCPEMGEDEDDCPMCSGTGSKILDTCQSDENGNPLDPTMVQRYVGLASWTPVRL